MRTLVYGGLRIKCHVPLYACCHLSGLPPLVLRSPPHLHNTALLEAAKTGDATAISSLIAAGADVNFPPGDAFEGTMPIHLAARGNHAEALRALLRAGAQQRYAEGSPPLHIAADAGATDTVKILLDEAGEAVDVTDQHGMTALTAVTGTGNLMILRALISAGADPNHLAEVCDNGAFTALRVAVEMDCMESIKLLISAGANPNRPFYTRQLKGVTPVHWACRLLRLDCLETLLRRGGDPSCEEGGGVSLSNYTARPAGLKASDVVGAGNPCDQSLKRSGEEAVDPTVQERMLAALRSAEERRSGWGRRKTLVIIRALRAREPEGAVVSGTEEECLERRESALQALRIVWEKQRIAAQDRLELFAAFKCNRMAARTRDAAFNELQYRRYRPPMRNLQGEELATAEAKLQEDFNAFCDAEPAPGLDEIGIRRRAVRNRQLRQAANKELGWAMDLELRGILERLTRHGGGSLPSPIFQAVMAYV